MARPPRSFHLQPINGGLRARVSVPVANSPTWRFKLADRVQHDHGDLALGLALEIGNRRKGARTPTPFSQSRALLARGSPGPRLHLCGAGHERNKTPTWFAMATPAGRLAARVAAGRDCGAEGRRPPPEADAGQKLEVAKSSEHASLVSGGTESSQTRRWREPDSNSRSHPTAGGGIAFAHRSGA
jgi:hypothetical protein